MQPETVADPGFPNREAPTPEVATFQKKLYVTIVKKYGPTRNRAHDLPYSGWAS